MSQAVTNPTSQRQTLDHKDDGNSGKIGEHVGDQFRDTVEVGSLSHYLQGFSTIPGGCLGFLNHQQYHY